MMTLAKVDEGSLPAYHQIRSCTESYFDRLGDNPLGMGWPNQPDAFRRFQVMLDVITSDPGTACDDAERPVRLLDLGCGCGHLYEYIQHKSITGIQYTGIDLSTRFIDVCRSKHPQADFRCLDILTSSDPLPVFDYVVINGVFTSKCEMSFDQMWLFVQSLLSRAFNLARCGLAFNAMAKHVDWERDDLFHLPLDTLAAFACRHLNRNFLIRNDYGLYEFTTYIYKNR